MKNNDIGHIETDKLIKDLQKRLKKAYKKAYVRVETMMKAELYQYEKERVERMKQLKSGTITVEEYKNWLTLQAYSNQRLKGLTDVIAEDLKNADVTAIAIINGATPEAFAINANWELFQIEKGTSIGTSFALYDKTTVNYLIAEQPDLLSRAVLNESKDLLWNKKKVSTELTQAILNGESIPKVARRLQKIANMDYNMAVGHARTAMTSAQNAGRIHTYNRALSIGIDVKKQWVATLDGRTRHSHRQCDGEIKKVQELFSNGLKYPADPDGIRAETYNCRCTLVSVIEGLGSDVKPGLADRIDVNLSKLSYDNWKGMKAGG